MGPGHKVATASMRRTTRKRLIGQFRRLLTPNMRFALKNIASHVREQVRRACLWRWEIASLLPEGNRPYRFIYIGRRECRERALLHFAGGPMKQDDIQDHQHADRGSSVVFGDLPMPGSLTVPVYVHAVVPLKRPIEEIAAAYGDKLRRVIRQQRANCEVRQAVDVEQTDFAERELLRPYATARYGQGAAQLDPATVRRMALEQGRLDVLYQRGEAVSCHLGYASVRHGRRYWNALRFGFSEAVFSNPKRLHEINSINVHLAVEWALANGFDAYDIGMTVGSPDDGLLQWKRRRGGHIDAGLTHAFFHVRLPRNGAAQLLWDSPLFAVRHERLTLHLGLPASVSDEEAAFRYREMDFGGLHSVCVHHARPPGDVLLAALRSLFVHVGTCPALNTVPVQS